MAEESENAGAQSSPEQDYAPPTVRRTSTQITGKGADAMARGQRSPLEICDCLCGSSSGAGGGSGTVAEQ